MTPHDPRPADTENHLPHEGAAAQENGKPRTKGTPEHPAPEAPWPHPGETRPDAEAFGTADAEGRPGGARPSAEGVGARPGKGLPGAEGVPAGSGGEQPGVENFGARPSNGRPGTDGVQARSDDGQHGAKDFGTANAAERPGGARPGAWPDGERPGTEGFTSGHGEGRPGTEGAWARYGEDQPRAENFGARPDDGLSGTEDVRARSGGDQPGAEAFGTADAEGRPGGARPSAKDFGIQPGKGLPGAEGVPAGSGGEQPGVEDFGARLGDGRPGGDAVRMRSGGEQSGAETAGVQTGERPGTGTAGARPGTEGFGSEGAGALPGGGRSRVEGVQVWSERVPVPREGGGAVPLSHEVLRSLLGAWALAACSGVEAEAVEEHLGECGACADEARRLREAVGLLHRPEPLDVDPTLRGRVLETCLSRRPPRIPVPDWADAYDAETARLDALLQDFGDAEWHAPVRLRWFGAEGATSRRTTVAGVIAHLLSVDGLVATALGLEDPLAEALAEQARGSGGPAERTEAFWQASRYPPTRHVREPWRDQSHRLVRTASFTGGRARGFEVSYGDFALPLHDAMLDRAFECWVHAEDIARAVDYPYDPPAPRHLGKLIDLAIRTLPAVLAARPQAPPGTVLLEIEGSPYGGQYPIPLDPRTPDADQVAQVALDGVEFCRLAAGHISPEEAAAGQKGDREAISAVLTATASLSRM